MRRSVVLALMGALVVVACGGGPGASAGTGGASIGQSPGGSIVILTAMAIATEVGSEPIATGDVVDGSTLGGSPFCAGGTVLDTHASNDPAMAPYGLIDRTITCPDGTMRLAFTPELGQAATQTGSWTMVSGSGSFAGILGSGTIETVYDADVESLAHERFTGTVTR